MNVEDKLRKDFRECCCGYDGCQGSADAAVVGFQTALNEVERGLDNLDGEPSTLGEVAALIARLRGGGA